MSIQRMEQNRGKRKVFDCYFVSKLKSLSPAPMGARLDDLFLRLSLSSYGQSLNCQISSGRFQILHDNDNGLKRILGSSLNNRIGTVCVDPLLLGSLVPVLNKSC